VWLSLKLHREFEAGLVAAGNHVGVCYGMMMRLKRKKAGKRVKRIVL